MERKSENPKIPSAYFENHEKSRKITKTEIRDPKITKTEKTEIRKPKTTKTENRKPKTEKTENRNLYNPRNEPLVAGKSI